MEVLKTKKLHLKSHSMASKCNRKCVMGCWRCHGSLAFLFSWIISQHQPTMLELRKANWLWWPHPSIHPSIHLMENIVTSFHFHSLRNFMIIVWYWWSSSYLMLGSVHGFTGFGSTSHYENDQKEIKGNLIDGFIFVDIF